MLFSKRQTDIPLSILMDENGTAGCNIKSLKGCNLYLKRSQTSLLLRVRSLFQAWQDRGSNPKL